MSPGKYFTQIYLNIFEYFPSVVLSLSDILILFLAGLKLYSELREIYFSGAKKYFSGTGALILENVLSLMHTLLIYSYFGIRLIMNILVAKDYPLVVLKRVELLEDCVLTISVIVGWCYLFFFLLGFQLTGPLVIMVSRMLFTDVVRFLLVYMVLLGSFSQAFFVLFNEVGPVDFMYRTKETFMILLSDLDMDDYIQVDAYFLSTPLIVFYVLVVTIMLLNILVAMMGSTFNTIYDDADKEWQIQRAKIIFSIENEMTDEERSLEENKYWCEINQKRYLQVEHFDPHHYHVVSSSDEDDEDDDDDEDGGGSGLQLLDKNLLFLQ
eukprot:TRINITY_DN7331_c0_g1_i6.p1 TRINITY_DN7331_c0_g1~~TRINITY_DN7331_c0_g1_i6.p1  ORF type:complete len:324 (-),score=79.26 TRINITY_DN7331_c0_g1_i6:199-1170(-)